MKINIKCDKYLLEDILERKDMDTKVSEPLLAIHLRKDIALSKVLRKARPYLFKEVVKDIRVGSKANGGLLPVPGDVLLIRVYLDEDLLGLLFIHEKVKEARHKAEALRVVAELDVHLGEVLLEAQAVLGLQEGALGVLDDDAGDVGLVDRGELLLFRRAVGEDEVVPPVGTLEGKVACCLDEAVVKEEKRRALFVFDELRVFKHFF